MAIPLGFSRRGPGRAALSEGEQQGLGFIARVRVPSFLCGEDAGGKDALGFFGASDARQELAELKVSGDVFGMKLQQLLELRGGRGVVAQPGAFQRQSVTCERIIRIRGNECFQNLAARLLRLGHGRDTRIIAVCERGAKKPPETGMKLMTPRQKKVSSHGREASGGDRELEGKSVSASRGEMTEVVLPNDANPLGNMLGGRVMHLIDIAAALAAHRHSNSLAATVSVDYLDFRNPIKIGELVILKSSVNRVFTTSMEVGVKVFSENFLTGERKHTSSAYLTFVAVDAHGKPKPVRPLILETAEDRRRYSDAGKRRRIRLAHRRSHPSTRPEDSR